MTLTPTDHHEHYVSSSEWVGRLSACAAISAGAIEHDPKGARKALRSCVAEFIASPVPSEELRKILREYMR